MTPRAHVVYCTDGCWCKQQYICCCSPSLFCRQTAGNPQKLKSLNPTTQTLQNVFCCASKILHSPDWRRLMHLCYRCNAAWLLFNSCFPLPPSLHASHILLSKIVQSCAAHIKDRRCVGLKELKNFKVSVVEQNKCSTNMGICSTHTHAHNWIKILVFVFFFYSRQVYTFTHTVWSNKGEVERNDTWANRFIL